MNVLKFEAPGSDEAKKAAIEKISACDSCIVIYYDNTADELFYQQINLSHYQAIAFLECIKHGIVHEVKA